MHTKTSLIWLVVVAVVSSVLLISGRDCLGDAILSGIGFLAIGVTVLVWWLSQAFVRFYCREYRTGIAALLTGAACIGAMALVQQAVTHLH